MNLDYCSDICSIGHQASEDFLTSNNSAYDAAIDFYCFAEKCFKNCPYKDAHKKADAKDSLPNQPK
jgi:hypothetical protein